MLLLNISPKLFFLLSSSQIIPNKIQLLQIWSSAKSSCLMYVSLTHFKDKPIFSLPLSVPFLSNPPLFSDPRATLPQYFSPFGGSFFLSPRRDASLRLFWLSHWLIQLVHSNFRGNVTCWVRKVCTSLWICLDYVKLWCLCVCAQAVCVFSKIKKSVVYEWNRFVYK